MKNKFFQKFLIKSFELEIAFRKTCQYKWIPLITINELIVQIGHVYSISNKKLIEEGRKIDNLGDELSDVVLQLIILGRQLDFDFENYAFNECECAFNDAIIILGQLTENVMEVEGYRFSKPRMGFETPKEFQQFKLTQLFDIIFSYCDSIKLDICREYELMLEDANKWLTKNY